MDMEDDMTIEQDGSEELGHGEELSGSKSGTKLTKLKKELEQVKKEKQEYLDGWQRAKADYVTLLKRLEEERANAETKGIIKASSQFTAVLDSLARAKAHGEIPESFAGIASQLESSAKALGLTQFGEVGEEFDPARHEALGQDTVDDLTLDNTVTAVLENGWERNGTVVRPAKVRVGEFAN
jgi:molecular chaperone GrpE